MGANPSAVRGEDLPVGQISWQDCQSFLRKLNEQAPAAGFRPPTEAEWEFAARAGGAVADSAGTRAPRPVAELACACCAGAGSPNRGSGSTPPRATANVRAAVCVGTACGSLEPCRNVDDHKPYMICESMRLPQTFPNIVETRDVPSASQWNFSALMNFPLRNGPTRPRRWRTCAG